MTRSLFPFLSGLVLLPLASFAEAENAAPVVDPGMRSGLSTLDWCVIAAYAAGMLAVGFYYSYRTKTSEDFYLGGRTMSPLMVGLSLFATLLSTISYLCSPGEMIKHGPAVMTGLLSLPFAYFIVGYFIIPYIMKLPITSGYELLETRLGRPVRLLGSIIFVLIRLVWMGLIVFISAQIVIRSIGLDEAYIKYAIIVLGGVTVIYSSSGGLRAVVLTDVIQTAILFVGAIVAIVLLSVKMGGVGWFPTHWVLTWDKQPVFTLSPFVRASVMWAVIDVTLWWVCTASSDQLAIQRYLATRDAKTARRMFLINHVAGAAILIILSLLGLALLGFFSANPQYMTADINLDKNADYLFPFFIVHFLHFGMAGLVISGMLAAAMSSLSAGVNSVCTVINKDIVELAIAPGLSEEKKVRLAKWMSVAVGVVMIALAFVMGEVSGNIQEVTQKTNGLFVAPLFGLFFFAIFVPFATPLGATFGSIYGFLAAFLVAFWDLTGGPVLSFQWILTVALVVNVVVGCLLSLIPWRGQRRSYKVVVSILASIPLIVIVAAYVMACRG